MFSVSDLEDGDLLLNIRLQHIPLSVKQIRLGKIFRGVQVLQYSELILNRLIPVSMPQSESNSQ